MKEGSALQTATRWLCLISSILVLVLGVVHLIDRNPRLVWPGNENRGFADDNNADRWRAQLFTFMPTYFVDRWTPFTFGLVGAAAHLQDVGMGVGLVTKDFLTAGIFQLVMAMFAALAYNGGLGIIFSCVTFAASLMSFITAFTEEDSASLDMAIKLSRH
eukprot:Protomagalhaensia_wolfi_Nauph_80__1310@NODE_1783_length_1340_cov_1393_476556_g1389_i0_p2_GENE_NODE_1783_length_1340_cov_1393_476556_g1389_i0NODE_1783_length_1340_cov_1393_476556_g1389_i0_p2_ORF_typecomplete_len160_score17_27_NODE_1783_length_1340_cov_1393_476556_g1389_i0117596